MLRNGHSPRRTSLGTSAAAASLASAGVDAVGTRRFGLGQVLCAEGAPRAEVFRIEHGLVSYCRTSDHWRGRTVHFAMAGDYIGLGCLDRYIYTAKALSEVTARAFDAGSIEKQVPNRSDLEAALGRAVALEFEALKENAAVQGLAAAPEALEQRIAALLVVLSRYNSYEGRDPGLVSDEFKCGAVASQLDIDIDDLQHALAGLERRGLVEPHPTGGLRIRDVAGLDRLAESA